MDEPIPLNKKMILRSELNEHKVKPKKIDIVFIATTYQKTIRGYNLNFTKGINIQEMMTEGIFLFKMS